jgi:predicted SnoaL-like aldol condensation-catalyzing enzyme
VSAPKAAGESSRLRLFRKGTEQFVAAFNAGDMKRASTALREDFEQHFPPGFTQRVVRGRDAWVEFFEEYLEDMSTWQATALELIEAGPDLFVLGLEYEGTGRSSGLATQMRTWDVIELDENGLMRRDRQFFDRNEALAAAGVEAGDRS